MCECGNSEKTSLINIRIRMTSTFNIAIWSLCVVALLFLPFDFHRFISTVGGIFMANWPFLFFFYGIKLDKGWILSVIGIENDHAIPMSKEKSLASSSGFLGCAVISMIFLKATEYTLSIKISVIVLWVYSMSRMITQVMGFYIYWIARMNNDPKLKSNAPDELIIKQSLEIVNFNFRVAIFVCILLLISLATYSFAEYFFSYTTVIRIGFILYSVLLFFWIVLSLVLCQLFDKNVVLSCIFQTEFFEKQCVIIKSSMQKRLSFMKFLSALLLFVEIILLCIIIKGL